MELKKMKRVEIIDDFPMDCWCHVIQFLDSYENVISLFLTIKGLCEYVQKIFPDATRFVTVNLGSIPNVEQRQITNLKCNNVRKVTEKRSRISRLSLVNKFEFLFQEYSNISRLAEKIVEMFPNLKILNVHYSFTRKQIFSIPQLTFVNETLCSLKLHVSFGKRSGQFKISSKLPKLHDLEVIKMSESRELQVLLFVDWSILPCLKKLKVKGFEIKSLFDNLKSQLQLIDLDNTIFCEEEVNSGMKISGFECLREIKLKPRSIATKLFQGFSDLRMLRKLTIQIPRRKRGFVSQIAPISNFPLVEKIELKSEEFCNGWIDWSDHKTKWINRTIFNSNDKSELIIHSNPSLKIFKMSGISKCKKNSSDFKVVLRKNPKMEKIVCRQTNINVVLERTQTHCEFRHLKVLEFYDSMDSIDSNFISNLDMLKNIRKIKLVSQENTSQEQKNVEKTNIDVIGNPFIEKLVVERNSFFELQMVSNCPKLSHLEFNISPHFKLQNCPSLKTIVVDCLFGGKNAESILKHLAKQISSNSQITSLRMNIEYIRGFQEREIIELNHFEKTQVEILDISGSCKSHILYDGKNTSSLKTLDGSGDYDGSNSLFLKNHPLLESVSWSGYDFCECVEISNCLNLKEIRLNTNITTYSSNVRGEEEELSYAEFVDVKLSDLENCHTLNLVGDCHMNQFSLHNVKNIRILKITSSGWNINSNENNRRFRCLTNENFPILEELHMSCKLVDVERSLWEIINEGFIFCFEEVYGLENLKMVEIFGMVYLHHPFTKSIGDDMDLENIKVRVHVSSVIMLDTCLRKYIEHVNEITKDWKKK